MNLALAAPTGALQLPNQFWRGKCRYCCYHAEDLAGVASTEVLLRAYRAGVYSFVRCAAIIVAGLSPRHHRNKLGIAPLITPTRETGTIFPTD
jgi:hypothetical protein